MLEDIRVITKKEFDAKKQNNLFHNFPDCFLPED